MSENSEEMATSVVAVNAEIPDAKASFANDLREANKVSSINNMIKLLSLVNSNLIFYSS